MRKRDDDDRVDLIGIAWAAGMILFTVWVLGPMVPSMFRDVNHAWCHMLNLSCKSYWY